MLMPGEMTRTARGSEADFRGQIVRLAATLGWKHFHPAYAPFADAGWPDLVLVSRTQKRVIFAELKVKAKVSDAQMDWLDLLIICGQECYIWKPADMDGIIEVLQGGKEC